MTWRGELAVVATAAAVPRAAVLAVERGDILAQYVEKSDLFAQTLVASGTYGFLPDVPSAYTQPLYGFFLAALYGTFGRHWLAVGIAQLVVVVAIALLVWLAARLFLGPRVAVAAALAASLQPYLIWHDMHVNREILDQLAAVATVVLVLLAARSRRLPLAFATGIVSGLAALGDTRLLLLPLVLAGYLWWRAAWRPEALVAPAALLVGAACAVAPWVVRNNVAVGCATVTTDARALWKANNPSTFPTLRRLGWIDAVPDPPAAPPSPQLAAALFRRDAVSTPVDECAQMRWYRSLVLEFWREQPIEKAKLAALATWMLWDPRATRVEDRPKRDTPVETVRKLVQPAYVTPLYAAAAAGLALVSRSVAVLAVLLLAYNTGAAMVFAGATRYRAPWDFVLALLAGAALLWLYDRVRRRT